MEKVTSSIENLELEAEKSLEAARIKANEILVKANEESQQILSSALLMDEVKAECKKILAEAQKEAEGKVEDSKKQAKKMRAIADKKVEETVNRMLNLITGAQSR